jgi:hypothetical protein
VWPEVEGRGKVIARKGSSRILVVAKGEEKASITVVGAICMSGGRILPIHVLKEASDQRCRTLNPWVPRRRIAYPDSGWMDELTFRRYFSRVQAALSGETLGLVLDSRRIHGTSLARDKVGSLAIKRCFAPAGQTGELRSLDRLGFRPLKRISQCLWYQRCVCNPEMKRPPGAAREFVEEALTGLPTAAIV